MAFRTSDIQHGVSKVKTMLQEFNPLLYFKPVFTIVPVSAAFFPVFFVRDAGEGKMVAAGTARSMPLPAAMNMRTAYWTFNPCFRHLYIHALQHGQIESGPYSHTVPAALLFDGGLLLRLSCRTYHESPFLPAPGFSTAAASVRGPGQQKHWPVKRSCQYAQFLY